MPSLNASCFAKFGCYSWKAWPFLKENRNSGSEVELKCECLGVEEEGEAMIVIYCMREE